MNFKLWLENFDAESRIELTCIDLPDNADETEQCRYEETMAMYERAKQVANRFRITYNIQPISSVEPGHTYGDAYIYPTLESLIPVLDALDAEDIDYDNIDLPKKVPNQMVAQLLQRYPRGMGISVNVGDYP